MRVYEHIKYIHLNTHAHVYIPQLITARLTGAQLQPSLLSPPSDPEEREKKKKEQKKTAPISANVYVLSSGYRRGEASIYIYINYFLFFLAPPPPSGLPPPSTSLHTARLLLLPVVMSSVCSFLSSF